MSERLSKPDEPTFPITVKGIEYIATPRCAWLVKHIGYAALFDHVFVQISDRSGTYVFRGGDAFDILDQFMTENDYPIHLNVPRVTEAARRAYMRAAIQEIDNGIPDDWTT